MKEHGEPIVLVKKHVVKMILLKEPLVLIALLKVLLAFGERVSDYKMKELGDMEKGVDYMEMMVDDMVNLKLVADTVVYWKELL